MLNKENKALNVLKTLNPAQFWIFVMLRSLCDKQGYIKKEKSLNYIAPLVNFAEMGDGRQIKMTVSILRKRLKQLAYLGIISIETESVPDENLMSQAYMWPVRINKEFLDFIPSNYLNQETAEKIAALRVKLAKSDELKKEANDTIRRLREEVRSSRRSFVPEFKLYKKDGSIDVRSVQYQRLWAWFVLLDVEAAFTKIVAKNDSYEKVPDYRTMAVWISAYGLDEIEGLLHNFYMSKRLDDLKIDAGDRWPETVLRFIYGSLKKTQEKNKHKKTSNHTEKDYEPRGGFGSKS